MHVYVHTVKSKGREYRYLVVEEYLGQGRRKTILRMRLEEAAKLLLITTVDHREWCGGWDLNPRRPTPTGLKPAPGGSAPQPQIHPDNHPTPSVLKQRLGSPLSQKLLAEFREYCMKKASREVCEGYAKRLEEIDRGEKPVDHSRWHITAYKKLARYLCEERGEKRACDEFKRVKSRKSEADLWVPSDQEMRDTLARACEESVDLCWFYKLLLYTGLRAVEVEKALARGEWVEEDGVWLQTLQAYRGSKRAFLAFSLERPPRLRVSADWVSHKAQRLGLVPPKYVRKYVSTKMIALGIQEIIVDFIQGRTPTTVLRQRYVYLRETAKQEYKKYAEWLREWLS